MSKMLAIFLLLVATILMANVQWSNAQWGGGGQAGGGGKWRELADIPPIILNSPSFLGPFDRGLDFFGFGGFNPRNRHHHHRGWGGGQGGGGIKQLFFVQTIH
jgi:hypothetical protein